MTKEEREAQPLQRKIENAIHILKKKVIKPKLHTRFFPINDESIFDEDN